MIAGEDARLLFDEITAEDLPQTWQELADAIGLANVMQLCRKTGGTSIYIPKWDSLTAPAKRRIVLRLFNGGNHKELAKRFELSERSVYDIVAEESYKKRQTRLFE